MSTRAPGVTHAQSFTAKGDKRGERHLEVAAAELAKLSSCPCRLDMELLLSLTLYLTSFLLLIKSSTAYDLIFAVNCGGGKHTDRFGIKYASDSNPTGIASGFGQSLIISRVHPEDMPLYQTERYHTSTFGYSTRVRGDGEYLLILKFAEVYFTGPGQKVGRCGQLYRNHWHPVLSCLAGV